MPSSYRGATGEGVDMIKEEYLEWLLVAITWLSALVSVVALLWQILYEGLI